MTLSKKTAVVAIFLDGCGRLLVGKRAGSGRYGFPAGKLEPGESPEQALLRELREETGVVPEDYVALEPIETVDGWTNFPFLIMRFHGRIENMEPDKCSGWIYMGRKELEGKEVLYVVKEFLR